MKLTYSILFLTFSAVQSLIPKNIFIEKERLHPKYTLKEWQILIKKSQFIPPHPNVKGIFPQPASSGKALTPRIIGGEKASEGQFPWQVAITIDDGYFCGGSVISDIWILTAGHCVFNSNQFAIRAGSLSPDYNGQLITSTTYLIHEEYNEHTIANDIGLISVTNLEINDNVNPILLPSRDIGDLIGETLIVTGWGLTSDNAVDISPDLLFAELVVADNSVCLNYYGEIITDKLLCLSTENGKNICSGDSGGPLIRQIPDDQWTQVGIVSFGSIEGCENKHPVGFTRITSYLDWISEKTGLRI